MAVVHGVTKQIDDDAEASREEKTRTPLQFDGA